MTVRVLFFASLRERVGVREQVISLHTGATVRDLLAELRPALGHQATVRVAVNGEYVDGDHQLGDNDEVALIPPVSGGRGARFRDPPRLGAHRR